MSTVNKVFNIPPAKGAGAYKMLHVTFTNWGDTNGLYTPGGVEVTMPSYVKEVVAPVYAGVQSGGIVLEITSWSGRAIKLIGRYLPDPTTYSGSTSALAELVSGTAISGVYKVDVVAICEIK